MEVETSDIIAALALVVSVYTVWRQRGLDKLNRRLSGLLISKEEAEGLNSKRADLGTNFVKVAKNNYQYKVFNRGKGTARNITLERITGGELLHDGEMKAKFPFPALEPQQGISVLTRVHLQSPRRMTVIVRWEDEAGSGEKEITSDVF